MKSSQHSITPQQLAAEIKVARIQLAKAESRRKLARDQARLAKRRRKEAKEACRRAKKQARLARRAVEEAKQILAEAEEKLALTINRKTLAASRKKAKKPAAAPFPKSAKRRQLRRVPKVSGTGRLPGRAGLQNAESAAAPAPALSADQPSDLSETEA